MEALEAHRAAHGTKHPATLSSLQNLAVLLLAQGKVGEAEPLIAEELEACRAFLGHAHPDTQNVYKCLLGLLSAQGKHREARKLKAAFARGK